MISALPIQAIRIPEFRNLILGRFFLIFSFRMLASLLGWWIFELTNDPLAVGMIGLSEVIPAVSSALYAGHIIDNSEKKKMLLICNYGYAILISFLALLAFYQEDLAHFGNHKITYFIYSIVFLTGICRAFFAPLVPSMVPKIVGKEILPAAITVNQSSFLTASVLGHAVGGFMIYWIGISGTLFFIVGIMILASFFFWGINPHFPDPTIKKLKPIDSMKEGIAYIWKTREVLGAMLLDMFAVLFGGAVALIPVFAKDILQVGAKGYGLLNAATDIGSMFVIIGLSFFPLKRNQGKWLLVSVAGFGLCIIGFGLSNWYWLSFVFLMLSGILEGFSIVIRGTIVQLKTPEHLRGRVLSVNSIFIMSSNELGQFESGVAARLFGVVRSVVLGGSMTFLIALFMAKKFPRLRKMEY